MKKILIVRFSSFGDIVQCMGVLPILKRDYPHATIDWLLRADFREVVQLESAVNKIWCLDRKQGVKGLIKIAHQIYHQQYDLIYDAHLNLRSLILKIFIFLFYFYHKLWPFWKTAGESQRPIIVRRGKERIKRFLLFKFRINFFPRPYKGIISYLYPLYKLKIISELQATKAEWNFFAINQKAIFHKLKSVANYQSLATDQSTFERLNSNLSAKNYMVLVPSAAWKMKCWPLNHFKQLVKNILKSPSPFFANIHIYVIGGPKDTFCAELEMIEPTRVTNLSGKLSLAESCYVLSQAKTVVSADTGFLHVADLLNIKGVALIGPTAFGFPSANSLKLVMAPAEAADDGFRCRPCTKDGRGKCRQSTYQLCMLQIRPEVVEESLLCLLADLSKKT